MVDHLLIARKEKLAQVFISMNSYFLIMHKSLKIHSIRVQKYFISQIYITQYFQPPDKYSFPMKWVTYSYMVNISYLKYLKTNIYVIQLLVIYQLRWYYRMVPDLHVKMFFVECDKVKGAWELFLEQTSAFLASFHFPSLRKLNIY